MDVQRTADVHPTFKSPKMGLSLRHAQGLGDKLIFTSFPENYFSATGTHLIDVEDWWCFDFNPFVRRNEQPDLILYPRDAALPQSISFGGHHRETLGSVAERTMAQYGLDVGKLVLRHPRLYRYEELSAKKRIVVHTTGLSSGGILSDAIMDHIANRYGDHEIIQVGDTSDRDFPGAVEARGCEIWETVRLIAESRVFIGVDSGPGWIAACYPRVQSKIILSGFDKEEIVAMNPMNTRDNRWHWYEVGRQYFNETPYDVNFTYSFLKI